MAVLNSASAVARASAQIGHADGVGACLANVYKWFGSVQSIGPGAGQYNWAIKGWNFSPASKRHERDFYPPAGVPVYYGPAAGPRWAGDVNWPCGDVGMSIGNGYAIFTDSPTGNTGIMSISARASQIGRQYLGWTEDFLGHDTTAGVAWRVSHNLVVVIPNIPAPAPKPKPKPIIKKEHDVLYVKSKKSGSYYNIGEFSVDKVTKGRAQTYSKSIPGDTNLYQELTSAQVSGLITDARNRRDALGLRVSDIITDALKTEDQPSADS